MKVYNRGRRTINPGTANALIPGRWKEVPDAEAAKLLKMYPRDLTSVANAEQPTARELELQKENAELKARLSKFEATNEGLGKLLEPNTTADLMASNELPTVAPSVPLPPPAQSTPPAPAPAPVATPAADQTPAVQPPAKKKGK